MAIEYVATILPFLTFFRPPSVALKPFTIAQCSVGQAEVLIAKCQKAFQAGVRAIFFSQ